MRALFVCVVLSLCAGPAQAQQPPLIRRSLAQAADRTAQQAASEAKRRPPSTRKAALFWSGLGLSVAGVTTSVLGVSALRTERTSTGNAPDGAYQACVALRNTDPIYATSQCGALKGKNLKLLWGGVALGGAGAALMLTAHGTSAQVSPGGFGLVHRWRF